MWRCRPSGFRESGERLLNSLLLELEMCPSFKSSSLLFLPICPGNDSKRVLENGRREGEMRGQNGERKRLSENLSADICACRAVFFF